MVGDGDFLAKVGDVVPKATAVGLQKLASEKEVDQCLGLKHSPSLKADLLPRGTCSLVASPAIWFFRFGFQ